MTKTKESTTSEKNVLEGTSDEGYFADSEGKDWIYTATQGTMSDATWINNWRKMRARWHPDYLFGARNNYTVYRHWDEDYMNSDYIIAFDAEQNLASYPYVYPVYNQSVSITEKSESLRRSGRGTCPWFCIILIFILGILITVPVIFAMILSSSKTASPTDILGKVRSEITLARLTYTEDLTNRSSVAFKQLAADFENEMRVLYQNNITKNQYAGSKMNKVYYITNDSVRVDYDLFFDVKHMRIPTYKTLTTILHSVDRDKRDQSLGVLGDLRFRIESHKIVESQVVKRNDLNITVVNNTIIIENAEKGGNLDGAEDQLNVKKKKEEKDSPVIITRKIIIKTDKPGTFDVNRFRKNNTDTGIKAENNKTKVVPSTKGPEPPVTLQTMFTASTAHTTETGPSLKENKVESEKDSVNRYSTTQNPNTTLTAQTVDPPTTSKTSAFSEKTTSVIRSSPAVDVSAITNDVTQLTTMTQIPSDTRTTSDKRILQTTVRPPGNQTPKTKLKLLWGMAISLPEDTYNLTTQNQNETSTIAMSILNTTKTQELQSATSVSTTAKGKEIETRNNFTKTLHDSNITLQANLTIKWISIINGTSTSNSTITRIQVANTLTKSDNFIDYSKSTSKQRNTTISMSTNTTPSLTATRSSTTTTELPTTSLPFPSLTSPMSTTSTLAAPTPQMSISTTVLQASATHISTSTTPLQTTSSPTSTTKKSNQTAWTTNQTTTTTIPTISTRSSSTPLPLPTTTIPVQTTTTLMPTNTTSLPSTTGTKPSTLPSTTTILLAATTTLIPTITTLISSTTRIPTTKTPMPTTATQMPTTTTTSMQSTTTTPMPTTTTIMPTTTTQMPTTTTPMPTTTTPLPTTTTPIPTTTTQMPTTTTPMQSTTTTLMPTTTTPIPTTTAPMPTTKPKIPTIMTTMPTSTAPMPTTTTPMPTTTTPMPTTKTPVPTTTTPMPTTTTQMPTNTTQMPTTTTPVPTTTTPMPTTTTQMPTTTTLMPTTTTPKPTTTTPMPTTTTPMPTTTTPMPTTTTSTPTTTTPTPTTTTPMPTTTTPMPTTTTQIPTTTTPLPTTTTPMPTTTTSTPTTTTPTPTTTTPMPTTTTPMPTTTTQIPTTTTPLPTTTTPTTTTTTQIPTSTTPIPTTTTPMPTTTTQMPTTTTPMPTTTTQIPTTTTPTPTTTTPMPTTTTPMPTTTTPTPTTTTPLPTTTTPTLTTTTPMPTTTTSKPTTTTPMPTTTTPTPTTTTPMPTTTTPTPTTTTPMPTTTTPTPTTTTPMPTTTTPMPTTTTPTPTTTTPMPTTTTSKPTTTTPMPTTTTPTPTTTTPMPTTTTPTPTTTTPMPTTTTPTPTTTTPMPTTTTPMPTTTTPTPTTTTPTPTTTTPMPTTTTPMPTTTTPTPTTTTPMPTTTTPTPTTTTPTPTTTTPMPTTTTPMPTTTTPTPTTTTPMPTTTTPTPTTTSPMPTTTTLFPTTTTPMPTTTTPMPTTTTPTLTTTTPLPTTTTPLPTSSTPMPTTNTPMSTTTTSIPTTTTLMPTTTTLMPTTTTLMPTTTTPMSTTTTKKTTTTTKIPTTTTTTPFSTTTTTPISITTTPIPTTTTTQILTPTTAIPATTTAPMPTSTTTRMQTTTTSMQTTTTTPILTTTTSQIVTTTTPMPTTISTPMSTTTTHTATSTTQMPTTMTPMPISSTPMPTTTITQLPTTTTPLPKTITTTMPTSIELTTTTALPTSTKFSITTSPLSTTTTTPSSLTTSQFSSNIDLELFSTTTASSTFTSTAEDTSGLLISPEQRNETETPPVVLPPLSGGIGLLFPPGSIAIGSGGDGSSFAIGTQTSNVSLTTQPNEINIGRPLFPFQPSFGGNIGNLFPSVNTQNDPKSTASSLNAVNDTPPQREATSTFKPDFEYLWSLGDSVLDSLLSREKMFKTPDKEFNAEHISGMSTSEIRTLMNGNGNAFVALNQGNQSSIQLKEGDTILNVGGTGFNVGVPLVANTRLTGIADPNLLRRELSTVSRSENNITNTLSASGASLETLGLGAAGTRVTGVANSNLLIRSPFTEFVLGESTANISASAGVSLGNPSLGAANTRFTGIAESNLLIPPSSSTFERGENSANTVRSGGVSLNLGIPGLITDGVVDTRIKDIASQNLLVNPSVTGEDKSANSLQSAGLPFSLGNSGLENVNTANTRFTGITNANLLAPPTLRAVDRGDNFVNILPPPTAGVPLTLETPGLGTLFNTLPVPIIDTATQSLDVTRNITKSVIPTLLDLQLDAIKTTSLPPSVENNNDNLKTDHSGTRNAGFSSNSFDMRSNNLLGFGGLGSMFGGNMFGILGNSDFLLREPINKNSNNNVKDTINPEDGTSIRVIKTIVTQPNNTVSIDKARNVTVSRNITVSSGSINITASQPNNAFWINTTRSRNITFSSGRPFLQTSRIFNTFNSSGSLSNGSSFISSEMFDNALKQNISRHTNLTKTITFNITRNISGGGSGLRNLNEIKSSRTLSGTGTNIFVNTDGSIVNTGGSIVNTGGSTVNTGRFTNLLNESTLTLTGTGANLFRDSASSNLINDGNFGFFGNFLNMDTNDIIQPSQTDSVSRQNVNTLTISDNNPLVNDVPPGSIDFTLPSPNSGIDTLDAVPVLSEFSSDSMNGGTMRSDFNSLDVSGSLDAFDISNALAGGEATVKVPTKLTKELNDGVAVEANSTLDARDIGGSMATNDTHSVVFTRDRPGVFSISTVNLVSNATENGTTSPEEDVLLIQNISNVLVDNETRVDIEVGNMTSDFFIWANVTDDTLNSLEAANTTEKATEETLVNGTTILKKNDTVPELVFELTQNAYIGYPNTLVWRLFAIEGWKFIIVQKEIQDASPSIIGVVTEKSMIASPGFSSLSISTDSVFTSSEALIYVDIPSIVCEDEGMYTVRVLGLSNEVLAERSDFLPIFDFPVVQTVVAENLFEGSNLTDPYCVASLGYPQGRLFMKVRYPGETSFASFMITPDVENVTINSPCKKVVRVSFGEYLNKTRDLNSTEVRCGVVDTPAILNQDGVIFSNTEAINIIPDSVCINTTTMTRHPFKQCNYIDCTKQEVINCPLNTCFNSTSNICDPIDNVTLT